MDAGVRTGRRSGRHNASTHACTPRTQCKCGAPRTAHLVILDCAQGGSAGKRDYARAGCSRRRLRLPPLAAAQLLDVRDGHATAQLHSLVPHRWRERSPTCIGGRATGAIATVGTGIDTGMHSCSLAIRCGKSIFNQISWAATSNCVAHSCHHRAGLCSGPGEPVAT